VTLASDLAFFWALRSFLAILSHLLYGMKLRETKFLIFLSMIGGAEILGTAPLFNLKIFKYI